MIRGIIIFVISCLALYSCKNDRNFNDNNIDVRSDFEVSFDSNHINLNIELFNEGNGSIFIPVGNWIIESKSIPKFQMFNKPSQNNVFNSLLFFTTGDNNNSDFTFGIGEMDFHAISEFLKIRPKSSARLILEFNNKKTQFSKFNFFLFSNYTYSLEMYLILLNSYSFKKIEEIVIKNEPDLYIINDSVINHSYGGKISRHIYEPANFRISKYNYSEKKIINETLSNSKRLYKIKGIEYKKH